MSENYKNQLKSTLRNIQIMKKSRTSKLQPSKISKLNFKGRTHRRNRNIVNRRKAVNSCKKLEMSPGERSSSVIERNTEEPKKLNKSVRWKDKTETRFKRGSMGHNYTSSYLSRTVNPLSVRTSSKKIINTDHSLIENQMITSPSRTSETYQKQANDVWVSRSRVIPSNQSQVISRTSFLPRTSSITRIEHRGPPSIIIPPPVNRVLSRSPQRHVIQRVSNIGCSPPRISMKNEQSEKQALYSQIRQLRSSVMKNKKDGKEINLYKQELAVLENEKLRSSIHYNRVIKQNEELYEKLKISEDKNYLMKEAIEELTSKVNSADKTIDDLEGLVNLKTQEKMDIEIELKQLKERMNTVDRLSVTHTSTFTNIQTELEQKTQNLKNQIFDLTDANNKLREGRAEYEKRITELDITVKNLENILTAKGVESEGIHNMLNNNKGNLEIVLDENIQLRNQLNFSEERYQKTETERIDALNKIAEFEHMINRFKDEKNKMEVEISILKNQNFEFSHNTMITNEDFNSMRRQLSTVEAKYQVDSKRFEDRKKFLENEIQRLETRLNQARNQVCEEKRLKEERDSQLKSIVNDLNSERQKNVEFIKENQFLKNELEELRLREQSYVSTIQEMKLKLGSGVSNVTELKNQISLYITEISNHKSKLSKANQALNDERVRNQQILVEYKQRIQKLENENNGVWKHNSVLKQQSEESGIKIKNLNSNLKEMKFFNEDQKNKIEELERTVVNLRNKSRKLEEKNHDLDTLINELKTQISSYETLKSSLENEISTLKSDNSYLASEFDRINGMYVQLEKIKRELEDEVRELKEENKEINLLNNELEQKVVKN